MVSTALGKMPKVRRENVPAALLNHLLDRMRDRDVTSDQLGLLADWLDEEPEVPTGNWYKRFSGMTVCGEGKWVKTFLTTAQRPHGIEVI